ncbi:F0F1 ATP synthase subunit alpha, partial [Litorivicinus sp.]|nr:F0F1 ATP synthase subunit alpha [Litorivicinus sp.]
GFLDDVDLNKIVAFEVALLAYFRTEHSSLRKTINKSGDYNDEIAGKLKEVVETFKSSQTY